MIVRRNKSILAFALLLAGLEIHSSALAQSAQQPQELDLRADQQNFQAIDSRTGAPELIEGTWLVKITEASTGNAFTALQAFTRGGVTVAAGTIDRMQNISPLYGNWKRVGRNQYRYTIAFFTFNGMGTATGMIKSNGTVHLLDHGNMKGTGTGESCDATGDNCTKIVAEPNLIVGKRLPVKESD